MRNLVLLCFLGACGEQAQLVAPQEPVRHAIMQGRLADGDPQIFLLQVTQSYPDQSAGIICTATLIGSKTLITAAHCVDAAAVGATAISVRATNVINRADATTDDFIGVSVIRLHPAWDSTTRVNDFALLSLERSPNVPPAIWNSRSIDGYAGREMRLAGYGLTQNNTSGEKRTVDLTCAATTVSRAVFDQRSGSGSCYGDAGGPLFYFFDDGVERVVGVGTGSLPSGGDAEACRTQGLYGRVDAQRDFILRFFMENESPECVQDGMCRTDCTRPDVDCLCKADGFCSQDCPNLLDDPDCPTDCVDNDVCAKESCPIPDPDCIAIGSNCTMDTQCREACINDAQNDDPYCTSSCLRDADCPDTMTCNPAGLCIKTQLPSAKLGEPCVVGATRCLNQTECAAGHCVNPCANDSNCRSGELCMGLADGIRFCQAASGQATQSTSAQPTTQSCASASQPWYWAFVLVALLMRRAGARHRNARATTATSAFTRS